MLHRLLASTLALAFSLVAGIPPCVGVDMTPGAVAEHRCCDAGTCLQPDGDVPQVGASMPDPACCVIGSAPSPRPPADRVQVNTAGQWLPAPKALTGGTSVPVRDPILLSGADPPGSPSFALHLFLCVFLI